MAILTIIPQMHNTFLRMKGLSIKSAGDAGHEIIRDESGYSIPNEFHVNPKTAQIDLNYLTDFLKELHEELPFDGIKIKGKYEITGDELFELVLKCKD